MYHKPRMCRTCLQMSRGDFKFVNLDSVDPLWESNSPNLKEQLIYIVPEMKLESTETYICTSCFIALRTAYEFKRMCQVTEQKFQNYNYKYRRPFGVGPGSPQFHVTLNESCNNSTPAPASRCQNLNYLQTDTSIDITEHHLYDASRVLPRKQLAYLNNVSQKLPEIDVEVIIGQNNSDKNKDDSKENKKEKPPENKDDPKSDNKNESKPESKVESKPEKKIESKPQNKIESKPQNKVESKPPNKVDSKPPNKVESKPPNKIESKPPNKVESKPSNKVETKPSNKVEGKPPNKVECKPPNKVETKPPNKVESKIENKTETKPEKKIENKSEVKVDNKPAKEEEKKETGIQKEVKSKPIFPNLPGIEFLPKKLDSLELRKKYNIGSQISILKTPKQSSSVDNVLKTACEEIPYLKTNNISPDALNCSVRLELLTSQLTTKVTAEKYKVDELEEIAKSYYAGCNDALLNCKFCDRSFSTEYWLNVHEEDHTKPKPVPPQLPAEIQSVELISKSTEDNPKTSTSAIQPTFKESTSNTSKIAIPLQLQNDQISITPIQKSSSLLNTSKPIVTKVIEKPVETKPEPEISLSTIKKPSALPAVNKSSEISLAKAETSTIPQSPLKEKEFEKISLKSEDPLKLEPTQEVTKTPIETPSAPSTKEKSLKNAIDTPPSVPEEDSTSKSNQIKTSWKTNKLIGLRYQRCLVCLKSFRNKLSLYQHCKFVHIPNVSCSNYWAHFISYLKAEKRKKAVEYFENKQEEYIENKEEQYIENKEEEYIENKEELYIENKEEEYIVPKDVEYEEEAEDDEESAEAESIHNDEEKVTDVNQHICNICDKRVKEAPLLSLHMYVHTPTFVSMDPDMRSDENGDVFRCYLCEKTFPKERYLKLHNLQVHLTKLVVCKTCNREFKSEFWFSRHKCVIPSEIPEPEEEVLDEEGKEFSCTLCDRKFARLRFMKSHRKRMHKNLLPKPPEADDDMNDTIQIMQDRNDSDDSEHSGYESNHEYDLPSDQTKGHEMKFRDGSFNPENAVNNLNELASRRRSLSRGVPKIQCDFCGEYIEETAYDKHIFEHNKLRLNKSLSKRKSLETNLEEAFEKKQILLKCHICYKSFKRRHNLIIHMSKHEGVENFDQIMAEMSGNLSDADETPEEESEAYLSDGEIQPTEQRAFIDTVFVHLSVINGFEMYRCCDRLFKLKAHFFRHFKKKHVDCELKFKNEDKDFSLDHNFTDASQLDISGEQLDESKDEIKLEKIEAFDESKILDELNSNTSALTENVAIVGDADSTVESTVDVKIETDQGDNAPKKRKWTRRTYPFDKKDLGLRRIPKPNPTDKDENTPNKSKLSSVPLTSNNLNKRKLSLDEEDDGVRKPLKTAKLVKKSDSRSEAGEDLAATALHLRQLDLLPVTNKTSGGYECHICERKFKQKCQLRDHFNVHTGDRPYKCDFCKPVRGFTQTSSLYVHFRRVHAVVTKNCSWEVYSKNGDCLICSDVFFKHSQMFNHMKTYYVENEFECHVCNKKFNMSCHFKTHNIAPEDMQHLFIKDDESNDEDDETLVENETDEKLQSDTDTAERVSGAEDNATKGPLIRCSKCDKTFVDKQQLRFHKKSLAHFQQIQAKRRKTKNAKPDEVEDEEEGEEEIDSSVKADATDTIEDIENGVKAIIKKIRIFKKHHCNICGSSFIRRMQLKKHKRTHKLRRSKNMSVDNLEETTTLELQDASELNQFIHDDNLSDDEDDDDLNHEMDLEQNSAEEMVDSTMSSLEQQPVSSTSSENSGLNKVDLQSSSKECNSGHGLDQVEEYSEENASINENSLNDVDLKTPEDTADLSEPMLQTVAEDAKISSPEVSTNNDSEINEKTVVNENDEMFDQLSTNVEPDAEDDQSCFVEPECVEESTNVAELTNVSDDLGQSEEPIENSADASLEDIQPSADHISRTNESAPDSKECDVQSVSQPNLTKTNEVPLNDLVFDEQNLISDESKCLGLDK